MCQNCNMQNYYRHHQIIIYLNVLSQPIHKQNLQMVFIKSVTKSAHKTLSQRYNTNLSTSLDLYVHFIVMISHSIYVHYIKWLKEIKQCVP